MTQRIGPSRAAPGEPGQDHADEREDREIGGGNHPEEMPVRPERFQRDPGDKRLLGDDQRELQKPAARPNQHIVRKTASWAGSRARSTPCGRNRR